MSFEILAQEPAPLVTGDDGVVRILGTRVRLATVIDAFNAGANAEEILQQYPSLRLADIYATICYYLQHRAAVDAYMVERRRAHDDVQRLNEARSDPSGVRDRLLSRKTPPAF